MWGSPVCARIDGPIPHHAMVRRRLDMKTLLRDPVLRRELAASSLVFIQAVEGRDLTIEEAFDVVDRVSDGAPPGS